MIKTALFSLGIFISKYEPLCELPLNSLILSDNEATTVHVEEVISDSSPC